MVRTRFAPSPTGYLHIGGLRTALYAYLFAKKHSGKFILRIEDTDQERFVEGATDLIYRTLKDTGLHYDEGPDVGGDYGPYIQSERKHTYMQAAKKLIESGGAYYCFCSKERLDDMRKEYESRGETFKYDKHCLNLSKDEIKAKLDSGAPYVIRQNVPMQGMASFDDVVYGTISVECSTLDDTILIKSDGMPTYNFANVVDDSMMEISHVIRGSEYLSSAPRYNLLYEAMGLKIPTYIHLPPVMKDQSRKLSKRDGDASYEDFINKGYLKEAIINYIALLGWSPGTNQEKFTLEELEQQFSEKGLNKAPAIFDVDKLTWLNGEYIRALCAQEYNKFAMPQYEKAFGDAKRFDLEILQKILQPRLEVFNQIPELVEFLVKIDDYSTELFVNKKSKCNEQISKNVLEMAIPELKALEDWSFDAIHELLIGLAQKNELKNGTMLWPIRIAMAGKLVTPGGAIEIAALLGKDECIKRLEGGLAKLS